MGLAVWECGVRLGHGGMDAADAMADSVERHETPDPVRNNAVEARFHCYWLFVQVAECLLCAAARLGEPA